jgi:hypothetical protein
LQAFQLVSLSAFQLFVLSCANSCRTNGQVAVGQYLCNALSLAFLVPVMRLSRARVCLWGPLQKSAHPRLPRNAARNMTTSPACVSPPAPPQRCRHVRRFRCETFAPLACAKSSISAMVPSDASTTDISGSPSPYPDPLVHLIPTLQFSDPPRPAW